MQFIDSHTHLDFPEFDSDRDLAFDRAIDSGVSKIVVSATTAEGWKGVSEVVQKYQPHTYVAYGLHPMFMQDHKPSHLNELSSYLQKDNVVAVGEIGLDYFIPNPNKEAQLDLFVTQLEIASDFSLPVIIHARKSLDIVLKHLRRFPQLTGSIHSFSGSEQQARQLIDLGFYLGFGGPITYTRATRLQQLVKNLPLDSMLLETDSPDQPDADHYGERNEPAFIYKVAETIAYLRETKVEEVASVTTKNAEKLFGFGLEK